MKTVLFAYGFAAVFVVFPLITNRVLMRALPDAQDAQVVGIRRVAESRGTEALIATWLVLCLVGGAFLLIRGRAVGWAWLGVAAVYALGIVVARGNRKRTLTALGDRGQTDRTDRQKSRVGTSGRFAAIGITAYTSMRIIQYAYPHRLPAWAEVVRDLLALAVIVCAVVFVVLQALLRFGRDKLPTS